MSIRLPGYDVKDGKVVERPKRLDASTRIRQKKSKRVRVKRPGAPDVKKD